MDRVSAPCLFITIMIITFVMNSPSPFRYLGFKLGKLAQVQEHMALRTLPAGYDARQLGVLMVAAADPTLSQQAVGELLGVDRTTMVRITSELEERGYLKRVRRPEDRRSIQLVPTSKGRALVDRAAQRFADAERELLGILSATERATLRRLVGRLFTTWFLEPPERTGASPGVRGVRG